MEGSRRQHSTCLVRRSGGSATNVVFLRKRILGWRLLLVCGSHGVVLLFQAIGLGEGCCLLSLDEEEESLNPQLVIVK
jgi:hypothetical protein